MQKKSGMRKKNEKSISKLTKNLDLIFSRFVRVKNANDEGICTCYTCGHKAHYKKMQAGHWVSRFYKRVRWDERNVRPQCPMCNLWKNGDPVVFRENLVKEIGEEQVKELESMRHELFKTSREYLQQKTKEYVKKFNDLPLAKKLGLEV